MRISASCLLSPLHHEWHVRGWSLVIRWQQLGSSDFPYVISLTSLTSCQDVISLCVPRTKWPPPGPHDSIQYLHSPSINYRKSRQSGAVRSGIRRTRNIIWVKISKQTNILRKYLGICECSLVLHKCADLSQNKGSVIFKWLVCRHNLSSIQMFRDIVLLRSKISLQSLKSS